MKKEVIEKIPAVLQLPATHHDVYCSQSGMENREKTIHKVATVLCTNATEQHVALVSKNLGNGKIQKAYQNRPPSEAHSFKT